MEIALIHQPSVKRLEQNICPVFFKDCCCCIDDGKMLAQHVSLHLFIASPLTFLAVVIWLVLTAVQLIL